MGLAVIKESVASLDLARINRELAGAPAEDVVRWALGLGLRPFMSTSFGPNAALMLDLVSGIDASVPVVWVDTGYNLRDTYVVADKLMKLLRRALERALRRHPATRRGRAARAVHAQHQARALRARTGRAGARTVVHRHPPRRDGIPQDARYRVVGRAARHPARRADLRLERGGRGALRREPPPALVQALLRPDQGARQPRVRPAHGALSPGGVAPQRRFGPGARPARMRITARWSILPPRREKKSSSPICHPYLSRSAR